MKLILIVGLIPFLAFTLSGAGEEPSRLVDPLDAAASCSRRVNPEYVGEKSCKKCHFSQHRSWKKTKMAQTFDVLKPGAAADAKKKHGLDPKKDYTKDATCLPCHTTGYGQPGGYPELIPGQQWTEEQKKRAKLMEGVQCESCHGPGSLVNPYKKEHEDYKKADVLKLGLVEPDAANCKSCHNPKSPTVGKDFKLDYQALIKDPKKVHQHKKLKHKH